MPTWHCTRRAERDQHQKGAQWIEKSLVGMCRKSDARGRNPLVLRFENLAPPNFLFGTDTNMLLAARGGAHPKFVNTLNMDCGCYHITRCSISSVPAIPEVLLVFVLGFVVANVFLACPPKFLFFKTMFAFVDKVFFVFFAFTEMYVEDISTNHTTQVVSLD